MSPDPGKAQLQAGADQRRILKFRTLEGVLPDVDELVPAHRTLGRWSLAQICRHLADTLDGSIDGMDTRNHRWKRTLAGKLLFFLTLRMGIPQGFTVDPGLTPPRNVELAPAVAGLQTALTRYMRHAGPLRAHPLFGRLSRRQWDRMHCFHCAHHLSFVIPARRQ